MAKPLVPRSLSAEMPAGRGAGLFLQAKVREVTRFSGSALAGDPDALHDLRVAVKRLRESLRVFRRLLPGRRARWVLPRVEELNDGLGRVRELDVLLEDLHALTGQLALGAAPLAEIVAGWQAERMRAHGYLLELWPRLTRDERLLPGLRDLARATRRRSSAPGGGSYDRFGYAATVACADRVGQRLGELGDSEDPALLHRLRIAIKRLKYTLEPFLSVLPGLKPPYKLVAQVQEELGLVHDADVLLSALHAAPALAGPEAGGLRESLGQALGQRRRELLAAARAPLPTLGSEAWRRELLDALD